jgi:predicted phage tail protein
MSTEIRLYGDLRRRFGVLPPLDVSSVREALHAVLTQVPGFRQHLLEHSEPGYQILLGDLPLSRDILGAPVGRQVVKIVPVAAGAFGNPRLNLLAGIAIVLLTSGAGTAAAGPMAAGAGASSAAIAATHVVYGIGMAMAMSGAVALLFPTKPATASGSETKNSYVFDGPANTAGMGSCVPVGYGKLEIGGVLVSFGIDTEDCNYPTTGSGGGVTTGVGPIDMPLPA